MEAFSKEVLTLRDENKYVKDLNQLNKKIEM